MQNIIVRINGVSIYDGQLFLTLTVAPHVGAWIEIILTLLFISLIPVAPHVGAWIEISNNLFDIIENLVAPHVGAQELFY